MLYVAFYGKTRTGTVMKGRGMYVIDFWKDLAWKSVEKEWFSQLLEEEVGNTKSKKSLLQGQKDNYFWQL